MSTWTVNGSSQWPEPSVHARSRYFSRSTDPEAGVFGAWQAGDVLDVPETAPIPYNDEFRFNAAEDIVICRREGTLTTVYGLASEHITNIHGVTLAAAVDAQFRTSYRSRIDATNLEEAR
jgi:hypothetical protein